MLRYRIWVQYWANFGVLLWYFDSLSTIASYHSKGACKGIAKWYAYTYLHGVLKRFLPNKKSGFTHPDE